MSDIFKLLLIAALLLSACAQQVSPTGGPKDVDAPKILSSSPLNGSVNFKGNEIEMEFDEFVRAAGAAQKTLVTPPLKHPLVVKQRKRFLNLIWTDTLMENTTYLFQFGETIVDVNESNPLDSNVFVFSTGSYIDSFEIQGTVLQAMDLKPAKDVWVMLYAENVDSLPLTELPRYFAKTDDKGYYHLRYLTPGDYKVFALSPVNAGYLFDQPDEAVGFLDSTIKAQNPSDSSVKESIDLKLFTHADTLQYAKEKVQIGNKGISFVFNLPIDTLTLTALGGEQISDWTAQWNTNNDSVAYWFPSIDDYDSLKLVLNMDGVLDTVFFRKPSTQLMSKRGAKSPKEGKLDVKPLHQAKVNHFGVYTLKCATPISFLNLDSALFMSAKDTIPLAEMVTLEFNKLTIRHPWVEGEKYTVFIPDSTICDRYGMCNDTLKHTFTATKKENFGQLKINFNFEDHGHPYIWQLLKAEGTTIDEQIVGVSGTVEYDFLETGKYNLKIIYDHNSNGKWDSGNYAQKIQPEQVKYYETVIEIRSNWISEMEWNTVKSDN